jgi:hypothetical protein
MLVQEASPLPLSWYGEGEEGENERIHHSRVTI